MNLKEIIRTIPDFPKPGIPFKDITPLLLNPAAYAYVIEEMSKFAQDFEMVAGIESRGFLLAAPLAHHLGLPLALLRKPGKLPFKTHKAAFRLEYGESELHVHQDTPKNRILIVDDVLATGGTANAAAQVLREAGCQVGGFAFLIELPYLGGRKNLHNVYSLVQYDV